MPFGPFRGQIKTFGGHGFPVGGHDRGQGLEARLIEFVRDVDPEFFIDFFPHHLFEIKTEKRDELLKYLRDNKIICLIHDPTPIPYQPLYKNMFGFKEGSFPKSEILSAQAMDLPMFPGLKDDQIKFVSEKIHDFFNR